MAVQAYILMQVQTGRAQALKKELAIFPWVLRVDRIMGPFDIIVLVEAESNRDIGETILRDLQSLNGVKRTLTCPII
jgi:DNA-binding Lrp family transcriptional regulator